MILNYEIILKRKVWNLIGSAEIETKSFSEGDAIMNQLMIEHYKITNSNNDTYAKYMIVPSLSID